MQSKNSQQEARSKWAEEKSKLDAARERRGIFFPKAGPEARPLQVIGLNLKRKD